MKLRFHTIVIVPLPPRPAGAVVGTRSVATRHGFRFRNTSLIDHVLHAAPPDVLIDEPEHDDVMSLVDAEPVLSFTVVPKTGCASALFGRTSLPNGVFGLWGLDVWTHCANPGGKFASWIIHRAARSTIHRRPRVAPGTHR